MGVKHLASDDATFYQYADRQIFVGDVLDSSGSEAMSVGYYRNLRKGDANRWVVTYDEVLVVTRGALTVRTPDGARTAKVGEILFLTKGTEVMYEAAEDETEAVYITHPHWMETQMRSEHAGLLDAYHPV